ncbi:Trk system potassium transporter TrkA [Sneathiella chinensis]|uniref:Trk system potassium uptake protein TrkA n=1 Tax=Sneathiella chinensis TaxID=349750 RepID=A0ABQ5U6C7_9PROT|nr:Trk system potassium transporter TrkA [Sneathiella chinensis]GLQ07250.1 Trk system potassium transport protein TrkA [Sneathiella chinensis]
MKVIVCGAGQVGSNIARQLARENNDVTIIDNNADLVRKIGEELDVQAMVGHASHPEVLEAAGAGDADMLIAVTYSDEVNMVACQVAHSLFDLPKKVARIRAQQYLSPLWADLYSRENLPIDVIISPEVEVAQAISRRLKVPGAFDTVSFANGKVQVIGVRLDESCPIVNTALRQLTELFPNLNIFVVGIYRNGKMIVPSGDDQMYPGDEVYFAADASHVARAMPLFGHEEQEARSIIIVGGGNIGLHLAKSIEEEMKNVSLKMIEWNRERAEFISEQLDGTVVLHGDALDPEILNEANVNRAETIVALTNDDEVNILSSLLAKGLGSETAITLINNPVFSGLMTSLGVDVVVDPRATTVSEILRHVRRGRIRGLHSFKDGAAEVVEGEALETSKLVGKPLKDVRMPKGTIIGAILRDDKVLIPRGDTIISPNDRVVIFALSNAVRKVEEMFSVSLEFF